MVIKFGKVRKKFGNFGKSSEISEIWKFRTFRKLRKNDIQLELWKVQNIRSDSETDPKVRLKVRNAGPYKIYFIVRKIKTRNIFQVPFH